MPLSSSPLGGGIPGLRYPPLLGKTRLLHPPSTVINVLTALAPRIHGPHGNSLTRGPWGTGPGLLLFLPDSGILSSVRFQTVGAHTALCKTLKQAGQHPGSGPEQSVRAGARRDPDCGLFWKSRHLWRPDASGLSCRNVRFLAFQRILFHTQTEPVFGGGAYPKYMNIHIRV